MIYWGICLQKLIVLDVNKGMNRDQTQPRLLRSLAGMLSPVLAWLFSLTLLNDMVPSIFITGDRDDAGFYRRTSLTSTETDQKNE